MHSHRDREMQSVSSLPSRLAEWYRQESATTNYDIFSRLPALAYFGFVISVQSSVVADAVMVEYGLTPGLRIATIIARAAALMVVVMFAALTLIRSKPVARSKRLEPRIIAILGVLVLFGLVFLERGETVMVWEVTSALLIAASGILTSVVLLWLGRSFSTMPEARRLVTSGRYRYMRHPLYLTEEIAVIGVLLQYRSPAAFALVALQMALQVRRMLCEEQVLGETFPEYEQYCANTPRLVPGLF